MREILFRGKRVDNGEWVEGYYIKSPEFDGEGVSVITVNKPRMPYYVNNETVGQYTGLCDKKGKKIFEGDIVKGMFRFGSPVKAVIKFQYGAFGLAWFRGSVQFDAFTSICNVEYEVIGNIHDNLELLKEGAE